MVPGAPTNLNPALSIINYRTPILIIIYYHTMNDILMSRIDTIRLLAIIYSYAVFNLWIPMEL